MNREQKLSLIIGFTVILLVGVLISDHLSGARQATVTGIDGEDSDLFGTELAANDVAPFEEEPAPLPAPDEAPMASMEPITVIDQSATERPSDLEREHADLLTEIAERGGKVVNQGTNLLLELPDSPPPLAKADTPETPKAKEIWHTVARDDTLWELSERYYGTGSRWKLIADRNAERIGEGNALRVGARLLIPRRPGMSSPPAKAKTDPVRTYTVRPNDTIGEIAQSLLGTSRRWREIVELNRDVIANEHTVRVGDVLKIPAK